MRGLFFAETAKTAQSDPEVQDPGKLLVSQHFGDPNDPRRQPLGTLERRAGRSRSAERAQPT